MKWSAGVRAKGLSAVLQHWLDPRPGRGLRGVMGYMYYSGQQQRFILQSVPGTVGGSNFPADRGDVLQHAAAAGELHVRERGGTPKSRHDGPLSGDKTNRL